MVPTRVYPRKYIITHRDTSVSSFSWRQTVWEGMKTNNDNTKRQNYFPWVHLKYFASYLMIWIFDCFLYCFMGYIKNESKCWTSLLCVKTSKMYVKKDVNPSLMMTLGCKCNPKDLARMSMASTWNKIVSVELSRLVLHSILSSASAWASSPSARATAGLSRLINDKEDDQLGRGIIDEDEWQQLMTINHLINNHKDDQLCSEDNQRQ